MSMCCRNKQIRENINIEKRIKMDKKNKKGAVRVLLLGTNQSGKSTLIRQLKIVHGVGFSEEEKRNVVPIHQQIVKTIQDLIFEMNLLNEDNENLANKENVKKLMQKQNANVRTFAKEDMHTAKMLWSEQGLSQCCETGSEYQLSGSQRYVMHHIDRVTESNYLNSTDHVQGIAEYLYHIGDLSLQIIDIRGMRTEIRKWIHYFENIPALMFIAALSDYDQIDTDNKNRMDLAKTLFKTYINNQWLRTCGIVLLLNKKDILEEKIMVSHLVDYYPEFKGPKKDVQAAREFILQMFLELSTDPDRIIYKHFICLSDTENVRYIPEIVKDSILERNLKTYHGES